MPEVSREVVLVVVVGGAIDTIAGGPATAATVGFVGFVGLAGIVPSGPCALASNLTVPTRVWPLLEVRVKA